MPFIRHHPCDKCGSRNNLAEYSNGYWCWTCQIFTPKNDNETLRSRIENSVKEVNEHGLVFEQELPQKAVKWLLSYGITKEEMEQFRWEPEKEILVLLHTEEFYQGRCFAENPRTKYYGKGQKPLTIYENSDKLLCDGSSTLVFVEDVLSAIKISRLCSASPLLGSSLPKEWALKAAGKYKNYAIWLDPDKRKESIKIAREYSQILGNVKVIISDKDPKEHSDEEIRRLVYD